MEDLARRHGATSCRGYAALSVHAPDSHRARYSGSCLNGRLRSPRTLLRSGSKDDKPGAAAIGCAAISRTTAASACGFVLSPGPPGRHPAMHSDRSVSAKRPHRSRDHPSFRQYLQASQLSRPRRHRVRLVKALQRRPRLPLVKLNDPSFNAPVYANAPSDLSCLPWRLIRPPRKRQGR
jgi:hypothetical protein